ncbi:MAG TPA: NADH-quinone oxidoreductase subunit L [Verrucomicrobiae bacterium]|nr:NADH-quinone oxidoreductase subunit L [Verrucomicrobiae bacterium]
MNGILHNLWLIPVFPLLAAALSAVSKQRHRLFAASLAIGSMGLSLILSCAAFAAVLARSHQGLTSREVFNFPWFQMGEGWVKLGWVLDPLTAMMLVMVCLVGLLIFIYSLGYMAHDENFTRFFCFLSLFAAAMLGLVIANSLLLFFMCWELVGLTSYLLIGFWYHKPSAERAALKAFITTRIGDLAFLLGIVWLYSQTGTLLFYDGGRGCIEQSALGALLSRTTALGMAASTGIGLLIFCGAIGKSGQVPLHVWLPDAMEGPTPVSALIHAATMVAAGVFLVARVYPLMAVSHGGAPSGALIVVTWVGAITAVFAATIAVAQIDIKRILAYSTVSQLGFMMMGLGAGGVAVGMFHLMTHAFFKALLFLGAGSVIHGCRDEQDVRCMGGLRRFMPLTFATYAIGMMALSGVPLFFSGFWSKDEILHAAHGWSISRLPFYLGAAGAFLTAFYMTRQVFYVFFGNCRLALGKTTASEQRTMAHAGLPAREHPHIELPAEPHESPLVMIVPLAVLAFFSIVLGFIGTPIWPWFQAFLNGEHVSANAAALFEKGMPALLLTSSIIVFAGIGLGWWFYGRQPVASSEEPDVLECLWPNLFRLLHRKYFVDEIYQWAVVGLNDLWAKTCAWLEEHVWNGAVNLVSYIAVGLAWLDRLLDEYVVNLGFDESCRGLRRGGALFSRIQDGRVQHYLRILSVALGILVLILIWGCRAS